MHELSIAESIIKIIGKELAERNVTTAVEKVTLKAGRLNAIIPDSLSFHFDALKKRYPQLVNAVLEIHQVPIQADCLACDNHFVIEEPVFVCPRCNSPVSIRSGKELSIESITVADAPEEAPQGS